MQQLHTQNSILFFVLACLIFSMACGSRSPGGNQLMNDDQALYSCLPLGDLQLCLPSPGKGFRIMALVTPSATSKQDLDKSLQARLTNSYRPTLLSKLMKEDNLSLASEAKLKADHPGLEIFAINDYFPAFIAESFNRMLSYSGPNCYNTVLILTGFLRPEQRYVTSIEEFEEYLQRYFQVTDAAPKFGDIVVYNAASKRDHVAFYLFDGIVLHKKGFDRQYRYRITRMDAVYQPEPFEFAPDVIDSQAADPSTVKKNLRIYRLRTEAPEVLPLSEQEQSMINIIDFFVTAVMQEVPRLRLHEQLGISVERLAEELLGEFAALKSSPNFQARAAYGQLVSIHQQIFLNLEAEIFASPLANINEANRQFCLVDKPYLHKLLALLFSYKQARQPTSEELARTASKLKAVDRVACRFNYFELL